jgi:hypothetical protein
MQDNTRRFIIEAMVQPKDWPLATFIASMTDFHQPFVDLFFSLKKHFRLFFSVSNADGLKILRPLALL